MIWRLYHETSRPLLITCLFALGAVLGVLISHDAAWDTIVAAWVIACIYAYLLFRRSRCLFDRWDVFRHRLQKDGLPVPTLRYGDLTIVSPMCRFNQLARGVVYVDTIEDLKALATLVAWFASNYMDVPGSDVVVLDLARMLRYVEVRRK